MSSDFSKAESREPSQDRASWLTVVTVSLMFHAALMGLYLAAFHGDWSAFVCVDKERLGTPPFEHIGVGFPLKGFDGQSYYAIARDPWRFQSAEVMHAPCYWHSRLLYPVLAWSLSAGGQPAILIVVLPLINLACIGVLTWLGCRLALHFQRSAWWGLLLAVSLNPGMAALRDLTDPLSTMACVGLLVAFLLNDSPIWIVFWGAAAVFSREQNLVLLALLACRHVLDRRPGAAACCVLAGLPWFIWVLFLHWGYGAWPFVGENLAWPLQGMLFRWSNLAHPGGRVAGMVHAAGMSLLTLEVVLAIMMLSLRAGFVAGGLALFGAFLVVFGGESIYFNGWSYNRVFVFLPMGIGVWAMQTNRAWPLYLTGGAAMWPILAVAQAWLR